MAKNAFLQLRRDEQAAAVRLLMVAGHSYASAAIAVGLDKKRRGVIAGICRDYDIRTTRSAGFDDLPKSASGVVLRVATSEQTRCKAPMGEYVCRYERETNSDYCGRPEHRALEQKRRMG